MTRRRTCAGSWLAALSVGACGGGAPLLHAAHTLPEGAVSLAAGTSGQLALGGLAAADDELSAARALPGGALSADERSGFVKGALARFAVAPGVSPFVAARVGLGHHHEAGLSYTGRSVRLDGRHAFEWPSLALSLGASGSGALSRAGDKPTRELQDAGQDRGLRAATLTSLRGYALELPVLFGYRSDADVVKLWAGLRVGFERDTFDVSLVQVPDEAFGTSGDATRLWAGGLLGFSIGLSPIDVRVELDAAYQSAHGNLLTGGGQLRGDVAGWTLTPAMAISAKL